AVRALGLSKTGKQKLDIYRGLTNLNIDKANNLEYFEAQLPLYESLGDEDLYARSSCCMNIGFLLIKSDVARAVKMFDQGEALCAKSGVSPELFLMESGCALQRAKQYSLAEKYFRKIVKMPEYRDNKRIRDSVDMRLEQCLLEQKKLKNSKSVAK
ncbi:MAG: hypothetical protein K2X29_10785, partial [Candidatus Obscuribacterales bacterium]|nr:hypothetical protein [Candidatus Obscuribacterales bacterium]